MLLLPFLRVPHLTNARWKRSAWEVKVLRSFEIASRWLGSRSLDCLRHSNQCSLRFGPVSKVCTQCSLWMNATIPFIPSLCLLHQAIRSYIQSFELLRFEGWATASVGCLLLKIKQWYNLSLIYQKLDLWFWGGITFLAFVVKFGIRYSRYCVEVF